MLAALLSFVAGLTLDCQRKRARQAFEIQLNMLSLLLRQAAMPPGGTGRDRIDMDEKSRAKSPAFLYEKKTSR